MKSNDFALLCYTMGFKKLAPAFHPIRTKTKTNHHLHAHILLCFTSATCNYFKFWYVHCIVCVLCDWIEWLRWFWLYTTLKWKALQWFLFCLFKTVFTFIVMLKGQYIYLLDCSVDFLGSMLFLSWWSWVFSWNVPSCVQNYFVAKIFRVVLSVLVSRLF